jgi:hypothetical protein
MQNFTHRGFGPDPARYAEPEPVFPLSRKRPSRRPAFPAQPHPTSPSYASRAPDAWPVSGRLTPLPHTWPFNADVEGIYEIEDDFAADAALPRPSTARQFAVRIFGFFTICAVVCGCAAISRTSRPAVLNWVTLGRRPVLRRRTGPVLRCRARTASACHHRALFRAPTGRSARRVPALPKELLSQRLA